MLKLNSSLGQYKNEDGFYIPTNIFIGIDMTDSSKVVERRELFVEKVHSYVKNNHCFLDGKVWDFVEAKQSVYYPYSILNQFYTFGKLNTNGDGFLVDEKKGIYASIVRCEDFQKLAVFIPHPTHTARLSYLFAKITSEISRFYNDPDVFSDDWQYFDDFHDFILSDFFLEHCNKDYLLRAIEIATQTSFAWCTEFNSYSFKMIKESRI